MKIVLDIETESRDAIHIAAVSANWLHQMYSYSRGLVCTLFTTRKMCCLQIYFYVFCVRIKSRSYSFIWICYNYTCAELLIILTEFHVSLNLHFSAKLFSVFIWMPNRSLLIIFWLKLWTKWWLNSAKNRKKETFFSTCLRFSTYNSWTAWSLLFIVFSRNVTRSIT